MFNNIQYNADDNTTFFYTPSHMRDVYDDVIDRVLCWDTNVNAQYGYMFNNDTTIV